MEGITICTEAVYTNRGVLEWYHGKESCIS